MDADTKALAVDAHREIFLFAVLIIIFFLHCSDATRTSLQVITKKAENIVCPVQ